MEVKIGIQHATRELVIDSVQTGEDLETMVSKALSGDDPLLVLSDTKGRKVIVPTDKLAYVEMGSPAIGQVGFRS
ncbi:MAG: Putative ATP-binding protein [uncultured Nocardioidaceae bacterium]|uniref:ATP-binding protein n=1 Tax=uncultured Nocardioidaceae bacterium TaxID=253824 RepID=A0A6J4M261_9ACTN|nr:MAG: Putative ATP-binding protein [uncultured Nocardioidaceae bacterium]